MLYYQKKIAILIRVIDYFKRRNGCQTTEAAGYGITVDTSYGDGKMCFTMHRPSGSFALEVDMEVNVCVGTCATVTVSIPNHKKKTSMFHKTFC